MLLRASPAFSLLPHNGDAFNNNNNNSSVSLIQSANSVSFAPSSSLRLSSPGRDSNGFVVSATAPESNSRPMTGVIFEPFEEVKKELSMVPTVSHVSLARQNYADECEAAINEQIK